MAAPQSSAVRTEQALTLICRCCSVPQAGLFGTPRIAARQASLSFTISWSLLKIMSMKEDAMQLSRPLTPRLLLPSIFPSIRVFSNESALHIKWSKYWSFSISPSNEYSGLISLRLTALILQSKDQKSK